MIISRTPFRISLFGGGTDYPAWIRRHGGAVLGMAIDKYCYISVRHLPSFFEHKHRIVYSKVELVKDIEEIRHPAVRAVFARTGVRTGLEVHHDADLPARSGLGSSSSFTVGLLNALAALEGRRLSKRFLAEEATHIEQRVIVENVGCQDQVWAAYGGFNRIAFLPDGGFEVEPVIVAAERRAELLSSMVMVFTGLSRIASEVAGEQMENLERREAQLHAMRALVDEASHLLADEREPAYRLGALLHESWMLKRQLASRVTNPTIDGIYDEAMAAGASGGKLLGAGSGGFMVFFIKPELRRRLLERLNRLIRVRVGIDQVGSTIVVYDPDEHIEAD
ncbi:kinase [Azospirillum halopraeferens]|uniref:GHMP family kinase ATP-binding protein n=1 Tax=Azospirillum halopraeferens TaxID=34010 RepID=UPI0004162424|nr:kinase [Azospirillum halopraeferens]